MVSATKIRLKNWFKFYIYYESELGAFESAPVLSKSADSVFETLIMTPSVFPQYRNILEVKLSYESVPAPTKGLALKRCFPFCFQIISEIDKNVAFGYNRSCLKPCLKTTPLFSSILKLTILPFFKCSSIYAYILHKYTRLSLQKNS